MLLFYLLLSLLICCLLVLFLLFCTFFSFFLLLSVCCHLVLLSLSYFDVVAMLNWPGHTVCHYIERWRPWYGRKSASCLLRQLLNQVHSSCSSNFHQTPRMRKIRAYTPSQLSPTQWRSLHSKHALNCC